MAYTSYIAEEFKLCFICKIILQSNLNLGVAIRLVHYEMQTYFIFLMFIL